MVMAPDVAYSHSHHLGKHLEALADMYRVERLVRTGASMNPDPIGEDEMIPLIHTGVVIGPGPQEGGGIALQSQLETGICPALHEAGEIITMKVIAGIGPDPHEIGEIALATHTRAGIDPVLRETAIFQEACEIVLRLYREANIRSNLFKGGRVEGATQGHDQGIDPLPVTRIAGTEEVIQEADETAPEADEMSQGIVHLVATIRGTYHLLLHMMTDLEGSIKAIAMLLPHSHLNREAESGALQWCPYQGHSSPRSRQLGEALGFQVTFRSVMELKTILKTRLYISAMPETLRCKLSNDRPSKSR